jgi:hypothetical protein
MGNHCSRTEGVLVEERIVVLVGVRIVVPAGVYIVVPVEVHIEDFVDVRIVGPVVGRIVAPVVEGSIVLKDFVEGLDAFVVAHAVRKAHVVLEHVELGNVA